MTLGKRTVEMEDLSAFLDRELPPEQAAEVAALVSRDVRLSARLSAYRAQMAQIRDLYAEFLGKPVPQPLLAVLNPDDSKGRGP